MTEQENAQQAGDGRPGVEALKALAHPLRVQLIDALTTYGPATASGLADRLGESSGATSYHLRQLERHGFVEEDAARGTGRERWWRRVAKPITIGAEGFEPGSAGYLASRLISREWERHRRALLDDFLDRGIEELDPAWEQGTGLAAATLRLTPEQSFELLERLAEVYETYTTRYREQEGEHVRLVHLDVNLFPIRTAARA